jgi:GYF domain 2
MQYHVSQHGQNLGQLSVEEIRQRRQSGELGPEAHLWQQGMAGWLPIDRVLTPPALPPALPPLRTAAPVAPAKARSALWVWLAVIASLAVCIGLVVLAGWWSLKLQQKFRAAAVAAAASAEKSAAATAQTVPEPAFDLENDFPGTDRDGVSLVRLIAARPESRTQRSRSATERAFRAHQYQEAYVRDGVPCADPAMEAAAREFYELWLDKRFGLSANFSDAAALRLNELQTKLDTASPPVADALLRHTLTLNAYPAREARARALDEVLALYAKSRHRPYPRFNATVELANALGEKSPRIAELDEAALGYLRAALEAGHLLPSDQETLGESLSLGWGSRFRARNIDALHALVLAQGPSWAWLERVLAGEAHVQAAWAARGSGYANTVNEQGWAIFAERLTQADTCYTEAWRLAPERALAPSRLIYVAMGRSREEEMVRWFERALDAQIDYPNAWSNFGFALRPRWHGSHNAMLRLARVALDAKRYDTTIPLQVNELLSDFHQDLKLPFGQHLYAHPALWPMIREMYEGYIAAPDRVGKEASWRCEYAIAAYLAGRLDVARAQLDAVGWKTGSGNLSGWQADVSGAYAAIGALTGPDAVRVREAEEAWRGDKRVAAVEIYRALLETTSDEHTRELAQLRIRQQNEAATKE